jgi:ABC-type bacteriocin/lantibiotic exporter with double-glycine peptidase domain
MNIQIRKVLFQKKFLLLSLASFIVVQIVLSSVYPYLTKFIIDVILIKHQLDKLKFILPLIVVLLSIQLPVNVAVSYLCSKWCQLVILELRMIISNHFIKNKENSKKNGLFINSITNDCELIGNQLLSITINSLPNILLITVYLGLLIHLNLFLTLITLGIVPLFLLVSYIASKKVFQLTKGLQQYRDKLIEFLNSYIRNKLLIDLYGLMNEEKKNFFEITNKVKDINIKTNTLLSFLNNVTSMIVTVTPLITLFIGSLFVIDNQLSLGSLIAFNSYVALLFTPISKLLTIPPTYSQMKASIERIEQSDFSNKNFKNGTYIQSSELHQHLLEVHDFIPYVEDKALLPKGLNFSINKGEFLQIVGKNGCGKSVLLQSLINYHENFVGSIKIKKNLNTFYVPQENFLFYGTIRENLTKGLKDFDLKYLNYLISLFDFNVPLDQNVTPFSLSLSSGQMQKIKLIRALLSKPNLLLLDEVFANLDQQTAHTLIEQLAAMKLTTVFVYHGDLTNLLTNVNYKTLILDGR